MATKTRQTPQPEDAADARTGAIAAPAQAEPAQIGDAVHSLRNSMNTLLMNAAVLGTEGRDVPESLQPFVERIAKAGRQCSEDLTRLFELIDNRRR